MARPFLVPINKLVAAIIISFAGFWEIALFAGFVERSTTRFGWPAALAGTVALVCTGIGLMLYFRLKWSAIVAQVAVMAVTAALCALVTSYLFSETDKFDQLLTAALLQFMMVLAGSLILLLQHVKNRTENSTCSVGAVLTARSIGSSPGGVAPLAQEQDPTALPTAEREPPGNEKEGSAYETH